MDITRWSISKSNRLYYSRANKLLFASSKLKKANTDTRSSITISAVTLKLEIDTEKQAEYPIHKRQNKDVRSILKFCTTEIHLGYIRICPICKELW